MHVVCAYVYVCMYVCMYVCRKWHLCVRDEDVTVPDSGPEDGMYACCVCVCMSVYICM